jgi:hypothetical protein
MKCRFETGLYFLAEVGGSMFFLNSDIYLHVHMTLQAIKPTPTFLSR